MMAASSYGSNHLTVPFCVAEEKVAFNTVVDEGVSDVFCARKRAVLARDPRENMLMRH